MVLLACDSTLFNYQNELHYEKKLHFEKAEDEIKTAKIA